MKAYDLLDSPEKWTKGKYARNKAGELADIKEGACWCVDGALTLCYSGDSEYYKARKRLRNVVGFSIIGWNDAPERTFEEVQAALRKADV